jgi:cell division protein FtsB
MIENSKHDIEQLQQRVNELERQLNSLSADNAYLHSFLKRILTDLDKKGAIDLSPGLLAEAMRL